MPEETSPQVAAGDGVAAPEASTPAVTPHTETPGLLASTHEAAVETPAEGGAQEGAETTEDAAKPAETEEKPDADPGAQDESKPDGDGDGEDKPAEPETETPPEPPAPLTYDEPLTLPEGIELDAEGVAKFDQLIGGEQVSPAARQKLADMHVETMQNYAHHLAQEQHRVFGDMRQGWRQEIMADPELGGAGLETNRATAARMLDRFVPPERRDAFNTALMTTGMTDHPEMFRFILNVAKALDEPTAPPMPAGPPKNIGQRSGSLADSFYTHPRSPR